METTGFVYVRVGGRGGGWVTPIAFINHQAEQDKRLEHDFIM